MLALQWQLVGLAGLVAVGRANLLTNGDFAVSPSGADAIDALRVTGEDVRPFPGPLSFSAMELRPSGRSRVVVRSSSGSRSEGWYRCSGWSYVTSDYNGVAPELTAALVDGSDAVVPVTAPFTATLASGLGSRRNQWIHFDEWVPSNAASDNRLRLTFAPGHTGGILQLAQLSVTWAAFPARPAAGVGRYDVEEIEIWRPQGVYPARVECTLNLLGPGGECPDSYGDGSQLEAFDDDINTAFYASHATVPVVALELDLGLTAEVCGLEVFYEGGNDAAWTVKARGAAAGAVWTTWATAGKGTKLSGTMQPIAADSSTGNRFGVMCMDTRRIRVEMESTFLSRLYEVSLYTRTATAAQCDCRHGGICQVDGSCMCPTSNAWPFQTTFSTAFGWGGSTCDQAGCDPAIVCANDLPRARVCRPQDVAPAGGSLCGLGICGGPNTCTCPAGWHGTAGGSQCTATECGDGFVTTEVPAGSPVEQCDDGNLLNGDGCDSRCQLEPPPEGMVRATRQSPGVLLRREIYGAKDGIPPSEVTVAATVGLPVERVCCVRVVPATEVLPEDEVAYTWTEVYYRPVDESEEACKNGGEIRMSNFQPVCQCTPGYSGESCEQSLCERGCDHGSTCVGADLCSECPAGTGWEGANCGTASNSMRTVVVAAALATAALLGAGGLVVLFKRSYVPIVSRGATGLLVTFTGGIIWVLAAAANIEGESFGYDSAEPAKWHLWIPLFYGAGLWISSSLVYLRTMVVLHVFHHVPTHFICILAVGIAPWTVACFMESYFVAVLAAAICFVYTLLLISQLWSLRAELLDESFDASFVMLALLVVIIQLVVHAGGDLSIEVGSRSYKDGVGSDSSTLTFACSAATVAIVLLHFLGTSGKICFYAVFKPNDPAIMELYHNEFEECSGAFHKVDTHQLHKEFDAKVQARREEHHHRRQAHQPDGSFAKATKAIAQKSPHNHPKILGCFEKISDTHVGGVVSATTKTRAQYASRRKITHPYEKYGAENGASASKGANSDFEARLRGAAAADGDYAHLEKYQKGSPNYGRYDSSATKIQTHERGRQARKHVEEKRRVGKYQQGSPHYDQYNSSATKIQTHERGRQARQHVKEKRRAHRHGGGHTGLPGQPDAGGTTHHHHHRHHA